MSAQGKRLVIGIVSALLVTAAAVSTYRLIAELRALQSLQMQRAELAHVKYGLLNAGVWTDQIAAILSEHIEHFELDAQNRPQVKRKVEIVLNRLLEEIEQVLRRRNAQGSNWLDRMQGTLRQGVQDWLVDFDNLRARVPLHADAVLDELDRPETRAEIERALIRALDRAAEATFTHVDRTPLLQIQQARGCSKRSACIAAIARDAEAHQQKARLAALAALAGVVLLFLIHLPDWQRPRRKAARAHTGGSTDPARRLQPETLVLLTTATLVLLSAGVTTPMIEVEARIDELSLSLLGRPVVFTDQVLYFQSKSILDVVQVLAATGAPDMLLVAVLVVLFSLIFPAAKIVAGGLYYADVRQLREHAAIRFFALRSAKWSMADVLVVALFMAYIGFDGMIASQLAELGGSEGRVAIITTNGTHLQLGFFLFLAFVIASLLLSSLLEARAPARGRA